MPKPEIKIVSLNEALITGIVLDFIMLTISSTIMDGGEIAMRTFFIAAVHLIFSLWLVLRYKDDLGRHWRDFIRFGIFIVSVAVFAARLSVVILLRG